jgi:hypothetical protein
MTSHCGGSNDENDYERGWKEGRAALSQELREARSLLYDCRNALGDVFLGRRVDDYAALYGLSPKDSSGG